MCGIIGVYGSPFASLEVYRGLLTLQHRGQDAAGILSYHFRLGRFNLIKNKGLVAQVFGGNSTQNSLDELPGSVAIGHTRYSTVGKGEITDIQPFVASYPLGIGMCHNGNLVNYFDLAQKLKKEKLCHPLSSNDLEALQNIFAQSLANALKKQPGKEIEVSPTMLARACKDVFEAALGGYSVAGIVAGEGLFAFRDPHGIRPLVLGERELSEEEKEEYNRGHLHPDYNFGKSYMLSSESLSFNFLGYKFVRDLRPGEFIFIDRKGQVHSQVLTSLVPRPCMFEWVYFSSPESEQSGKPVYGVRLELGRGLAKRVQALKDQGEINPDIVVSVPETSRIAAISLASELKIPYREALIKNRYVHRSFILNSKVQRQGAVDLKLSPVVSELSGKKVLLVDDSIVRGTTSKRIIDLVRRAGAQEIYFASTCPPIRHPCFYGVDFPESEELVAYHSTEEEVAKKIGADKVIYLDQEQLKKAIGLPHLCSACIDGDYPVDITEALNFQMKRKDHRK